MDQVTQLNKVTGTFRGHTMITARDAVPGTVVRVSDSEDWRRDPSAPVSLAWVTVDRWEGNGDGTATLYADGRVCGIYEPDDTFPVD